MPTGRRSIADEDEEEENDDDDVSSDSDARGSMIRPGIRTDWIKGRAA